MRLVALLLHMLYADLIVNTCVNKALVLWWTEPLTGLIMLVSF